MGLELLGNILKHHKTHLVLKRKVEAALIVDYMKKLLATDFGQASLQYVVGMSYRNALLRIRVNSAPFKQEIALRERDYVRRLNEHFGSEIVKKITYS